MTRRTDHIRSTALILALTGRLTNARLADAVHIGDRQARRWIRLLQTENAIVPAGTEPLPGLGRPHTRYQLHPGVRHLTDT